MNKPKLVGITGGIGAGKSVVTKIFATLGVPVYDADGQAKWLMSHSKNLISAIKVLFGDQSFTDGQLNRQHIAKKAFDEPKLLAQLNALVHPEVEKDFRQWIEQNKDEPYLIKEAALLFEVGSYKKLDFNILISADEDIRIERVLERDQHRTRKDVLSIMSRQLPDEEKRPLADVVLQNDGTTLLIPQVLTLHERFSSA